jgi:hypothetical protein
MTQIAQLHVAGWLFAKCLEVDSLLKNPSTPLPSTLEGLKNPAIAVFCP